MLHDRRTSTRIVEQRAEQSLALENGRLVLIYARQPQQIVHAEYEISRLVSVADCSTDAVFRQHKCKLSPVLLQEEDTAVTRSARGVAKQHSCREREMCLCREREMCVFITAVPSTKLFARVCVYYCSTYMGVCLLLQDLL